VIRLPALLLLAGTAAAAAPAPAVLYRDGFTRGLRQWVVEQQPGGTVTARGGSLVIDGPGGCTVWFRPELTAPVEIRYQIEAVSAGGRNDRVSDLNCFWMARDPRAPGGRPYGRGRDGRFTEYDALRTYYVGMGGNSDTTTRFRRYAGGGPKPLLPAYDRRDRGDLVAPNRFYRIVVAARAGRAEYSRDGRRIFIFADPRPLTAGWFAFRTVDSHLVIRDFVVVRP
jgi:Domain of unknown function (DUF6250)